MKSLKWLALVFILTSCGQTLNLNRVNNIKGPNIPVITETGVRFAVAAPEATLVMLAGNFNGWNKQANPMTVNSNGVWSLVMDLKKGKTYYYKFVIDGYWVADPDNPDTVSDGMGGVNSVLDLKISKTNQ
jgi:1,4-alpha-glucan branching enzyme